MSTIKTDDLTPRQINMLVAVAEGWVPPGDSLIEDYLQTDSYQRGWDCGTERSWRTIWLDSRDLREASHGYGTLDYCGEEKHAGPIIDRERIATVAFDGPAWSAFLPGEHYQAGDMEGYGHISASANEGVGGATRLEAAMRAYVRKVYGDTITTTDKPWLLEAAAA